MRFCSFRFLFVFVAASAQTPEESLQRMLASKEQMTAYLVKEARRVTDQAAQVLQAQTKPERVTVFGKGVSGGLGLYAAILDPAIDQVMLLDPPASHRQGPIFLNVLRYTDLPEAAGLIAPRPLIFYGHIPEAYRNTRGARLAMSIEPVVRGQFDHNFAAGY